MIGVIKGENLQNILALFPKLNRKPREFRAKGFRIWASGNAIQQELSSRLWA